MGYALAFGRHVTDNNPLPSDYVLPATPARTHPRERLAQRRSLLSLQLHTSHTHT
jgi:hypothetical protein